MVPKAIYYQSKQNIEMYKFEMYKIFVSLIIHICFLTSTHFIMLSLGSKKVEKQQNVKQSLTDLWRTILGL